MVKYKKVYFRINTPAYYKTNYGVGFDNNDDRDLFFKAVTEIFKNDNWIVKENFTNGGCPSVIKGNQELYLHPQSFSGVVDVENIILIEHLLQKENSIFKYERVDIYNDVFDMTDDEYLASLESMREEIITDLLEAYKTKRSNLYFGCSFTLNGVTEKYRIKRIKSHIGVITESNIEIRYITDLFEKLVSEGRIIASKTKSGTGYRTDKKFKKAV